MASFFDLKARKAAAAANGTSGGNKLEENQLTARRQPWVEK